VPETFQALAVITLGLIPGAIFFYGVEFHTGAWGVKAGDRLLRFVVASALFALIAIPFAYDFWRDYFLHGQLLKGPDFPSDLYRALLVYLLAPGVLGFGYGWLRAHGRLTRLLGRQFAVPRAFDYAFGAGRRRQVGGWVRILLREPQMWIGGTFETVTRQTQSGPLECRSTVAGYPEDPDIYLARGVEVDPDTGAFILDPPNRVRYLDSGMLVSAANIAYLEFLER
jgi:hypothetical protein